MRLPPRCTKGVAPFSGSHSSCPHPRSAENRPTLCSFRTDYLYVSWGRGLTGRRSPVEYRRRSRSGSPQLTSDTGRIWGDWTLPRDISYRHSKPSQLNSFCRCMPLKLQDEDQAGIRPQSVISDPEYSSKADQRQHSSTSTRSSLSGQSLSPRLSSRRLAFPMTDASCSLRSKKMVHRPSEP